MESNNFYGDCIVSLGWIVSDVSMEKTRQVKFPENLHINSTIKSP